MPPAYKLLENSTDLNDDRGHARACKQRSHGSHRERDRKSATLGGVLHPTRVTREVDTDDVEHREAEHDKEHGYPRVEPRRSIDRTEGARCENHHKPEHAVDERHRGAVGGAQKEPATTGAGLRARSDDCEVDGDHREYARGEIEGQPANQNNQQDCDWPASVEQTLRGDALFRISNELEEVFTADVAACRGEDREVLELLQNADIVCWTRRRRRAGQRNGRLRRARAAAGRQPCEHVGSRRCQCRAGRDYAQGPLGSRDRRLKAHLVVARLVSKTRRDHEVAHRHITGNLDFCPDDEFMLEHGERLGLAFLFEIGGMRVHELADPDARRGLNRQHGRNQRRIARLIRLNVQALGKRHGEGHACGLARSNRGRLYKGSHGGARTTLGQYPGQALRQQ